jgi:hypothetical protein
VAAPLETITVELCDRGWDADFLENIGDLEIVGHIGCHFLNMDGMAGMANQIPRECRIQAPWALNTKHFPATRVTQIIECS